jgi:hypothetical protein
MLDPTVGVAMKRRTRRLTIVSITACVWTAVIFVGSGKQQLLARASATLNIETEPMSVHITVDSDKAENGGYIDTPTQIMLHPGRHKLKISRDGFVTQQLTIDAEAGDAVNMDDIMLVRIAGAPLASVEITSEDTPINCEIDDGFARGVTPLTAPDLLAGQPHQLSCYPKWPSREGAAKCKFTPTSTGTGAGTGAGTGTGDVAVAHLKLKNKNGKLKISGCDRRTSP